MKKIVLLSLVILAGTIISSGLVYAASPSLFIAPASGSKYAGATFNAAVNIDPQGNQVCVVEGTLNFNNLTCSGITVASGLMAQTTPTCSSPSFVLGIPKCTTALDDILNVSVRGNNIGQAVASINGVKVVGSGVLLPSTSSGGTYSILAAQTSASSSTAPSSTEPTVQQQTTQLAQTPATQTAPVNSIPNSVGSASFLSIASPYFWPLLIILIIAIVMYIIFWLIGKKKKKEKNK